MELATIYRRAIGLDVHQRQVMACVIIEGDDGTIPTEVKKFGGFKRDRRALAEWAMKWNPGIVVMESTGIYLRSPYAALERAVIIPLVVNARHVKQVPGRKTDVADCQWLAILARCGLLWGSFMPPEDLRNLRLIARQRQKLPEMLAAEKNRLHKVLTDGGVRLSTVVSDIHGQSARRMAECLIEGGTPEEALKFASKGLKASPEQDSEDRLHSDRQKAGVARLNGGLRGPCCQTQRPPLDCQNASIRSAAHGDLTGFHPA